MFEGLSIDEFAVLSIDEQVHVINNKITECNDILFKRRKIGRQNNLRWWTEECRNKRRTVRKTRRKLFKALRRNDPNVETFRVTYRETVRSYKIFLLKTKENNWRNFVGANFNNPWSAAYRICRGKSKVYDVSELSVNGEFISGWADCVNVLLNKFFPSDPGFVCPSINNELSSDELDEDEIFDAFLRVRSKKSPGLNGFIGEMVKSVYRAIPQFINLLFTKCFEHGYFPDCWKTARVIVLIKSPLKDKSCPGSHRGISLLPVLGKVLERIMVNRLNITNNSAQYGFRENRGIIDAWSFVKNNIENCRKKYVLGIFIDFKGAFDNLKWDYILSYLNSIACKDIKIWKSYFHNRTCIVSGANETVSKEADRGCPQGSICGPYIWNLVMDRLLFELQDIENCVVTAYADDLLVMIEEDSRQRLESTSRIVVEKIQAWSANVGVDISSDKSSVMLLKGRLSYTHTPNVFIGRNKLKYSINIKYLGITIGEGLSFLPHLTCLTSKLQGLAGMLCRIVRNDWGLGKKATRILYKGLFVACATFGCPIWYNAALRTTGKKLLLRCQRVCLLACLSVCHTVSNEALQVLLGAPPMDLEVIRLTVTHRFKRNLMQIEDAWLSNEEMRNSSNYRKDLEEKMLDIWQDRWTNSTVGRNTFNFINNVRFSGRCEYFKFTLFTGFLLTGHGSLNEYLFKRNLSPTEACLCGCVCESVVHIVCECPLYDDLRDLTRLGIIYDNVVYDFSGVLSVVESFEALQEFAKLVFERRRRLMTAESDSS